MHHLRHNDYSQFILKHFDHWVVVEGAACSTGSTAWCGTMSSKFHKDGRSIDGTCEYFKKMSRRHKKITYVSNRGFWKNKDYQVNQAIRVVRTLTKQCYLWEIDVDEQWTIEDIKQAETDLDARDGKTGRFLCNFYVGKNLLAKGEWGEGRFLPYNRLWKWNGECFICHEPPRLFGGNGRTILLPQRFNHFSYYFEPDIIFKEQWYQMKGLYSRWNKLQTETHFPQPITRLLDGFWGNSNTTIIQTPIKLL